MLWTTEKPHLQRHIQPLTLALSRFVLNPNSNKKNSQSREKKKAEGKEKTQKRKKERKRGSVLDWRYERERGIGRRKKEAQEQKRILGGRKKRVREEKKRASGFSEWSTHKKRTSFPGSASGYEADRRTWGGKGQTAPGQRGYKKRGGGDTVSFRREKGDGVWVAKIYEPVDRPFCQTTAVKEGREYWWGRSQVWDLILRDKDGVVVL